MNYNVTLTFVLRISFGIAYGMWSMSVLSTYIYILGGDNAAANAMVGYAEAIEGTFIAAAALPVGWLASSVRRDKILKCSGVVSLAAIAVTVAAVRSSHHNYLLLCIALALWGITEAASPILDSLFADSVPTGQRSGLYTTMFICTVVTQGLGPMVASLYFYFQGNQWTLSTLSEVMLTGMACSLVPSIVLFLFDDSRALGSESEGVLKYHPPADPPASTPPSPHDPPTYHSPHLPNGFHKPGPEETILEDAHEGGDGPPAPPPAAPLPNGHTPPRRTPSVVHFEDQPWGTPETYDTLDHLPPPPGTHSPPNGYPQSYPPMHPHTAIPIPSSPPSLHPAFPPPSAYTSLPHPSPYPSTPPDHPAFLSTPPSGLPPLSSSYSYLPHSRSMDSLMLGPNTPRPISIPATNSESSQPTPTKPPPSFTSTPNSSVFGTPPRWVYSSPQTRRARIASFLTAPRWFCRAPKLTIHAIPGILAIADCISGLASGMTVKFFPIFFKEAASLSPTAVSAIFAASPLALSLFSLLSSRAARRIGRIQTMLLFRATGIALIYSIALAPAMWRIAAAIVPVFMVRTAAMNCCYPLQKSVLMDFVPKESRSKWNSLEALTAFGWSGSAAVGGVLLTHFGFAVTFTVTATMQLLSWSMLWLLLPLVPREEGAVARLVARRAAADEAYDERRASEEYERQQQLLQQDAAQQPPRRRLSVDVLASAAEYVRRASEDLRQPLLAVGEEV